jgi:hypothetical protein
MQGFLNSLLNSSTPQFLNSSTPQFLNSSTSELLHFVVFAGSLDFVANLGGKRGG